MTCWIHNPEELTTAELLGQVLLSARDGTHVQLLAAPRNAGRVIQRLRTALSRSRARNRERGKKVEEFTLRHSTYDYTKADGTRHECLVMWIEKGFHHKIRESLDDLLARE